MALFLLCFWDSREETGRVSCSSSTARLISLLSITHLNQQLSVFLLREEASLFACKRWSTSIWNFRDLNRPQITKFIFLSTLSDNNVKNFTLRDLRACHWGSTFKGTPLYLFFTSKVFITLPSECIFKVLIYSTLFRCKGGTMVSLWRYWPSDKLLYPYICKGTIFPIVLSLFYFGIL